jgi:O-acetyl-ADP-ribose deacetylase (regulator of RNase III)
MIKGTHCGSFMAVLNGGKYDVMVNAANCRGPMGRGIAGALRKYGGEDIQLDAIRTCSKNDPNPGDVYVTTAGKLPVRYIMHACVMKEPGGDTSYEIVKAAFKTLLKLAARDNLKIVCTAFGTGVGCLDPVKVAKIMYEEAKGSKVEVTFVDLDDRFIDELNKLIAKGI